MRAPVSELQGPMDNPAVHDPATKKAIDARLAGVEGQIRGIRRMIAEADRSCEAIARQLAAAREALDGTFYEMVSRMIRTKPPSGAIARRERANKVAELLARFA